jgi:hypothetical protein
MFAGVSSMVGTLRKAMGRVGAQQPCALSASCYKSRRRIQLRFSEEGTLGENALDRFHVVTG